MKSEEGGSSPTPKGGEFPQTAFTQAGMTPYQAVLRPLLPQHSGAGRNRNLRRKQLRPVLRQSRITNLCQAEPDSYDEHRTSGLQVIVYGGETALRQLICFQQALELEQGRRSGSRFPAQVDRDKAADGFAASRADQGTKTPSSPNNLSRPCRVAGPVSCLHIPSLKHCAASLTFQSITCTW